MLKRLHITKKSSRTIMLRS